MGASLAASLESFLVAKGRCKMGLRTRRQREKKVNCSDTTIADSQSRPYSPTDIAQGASKIETSAQAVENLIKNWRAANTPNNTVHTVDDIIPALPYYGNDGIFLIMGTAGFLSSAVRREWIRTGGFTIRALFRVASLIHRMLVDASVPYNPYPESPIPPQIRNIPETIGL